MQISIYGNGNGSYESGNFSSSLATISISDNRCIQRLDGLIEVMPKSIGYILGEKVFRPFIDITATCFSRGWTIIKNGPSSVSTMISKWSFPPGAEASQSLEFHCPKDYKGDCKDWLNVPTPDYAKSQFIQGKMYLHGGGENFRITQNEEKGAELIKEAADLGNLEAQFAMGNCYEHGSGVPQDNAKAGEYYTKAANGGHLWAQDKLAGRAV